MSAVISMRRILLLVTLTMLVAAVLAWLRDRTATPVPTEAPQWPPLSSPNDQPWQAPNEDGSCPPGYPVKVKESSGIYHLPGGRFHERTHADRCYVDAAAAEADGFRQSKS